MKRKQHSRQHTLPRSGSRVSRIQWRLGAAIALSGAVAAVVIWASLRPADDSPPTRRWPDFPSPEIASSNYVNVGKDARYVGTQRCLECHVDEHASYLETGHSRSMSEVDPESEPPGGEFDHAASGRQYRVYREHGILRHRESLTVPDGELLLSDYVLKYLVGSGRFSRTYLVEDQEFLVESPVSWYSSLDAWAMSPGYDAPTHLSFQRTIDHDCLFCHAGQVEPIGSSKERLRIGETAIGCERCHGPGSLHVERWERGDATLGSLGDLTIVNPRRLPRERAEAVCHQCHLSGEARVAVRGRKPNDFRPGLRWQDFVTDYGFETAATDMTVVGHVAQLRQSACYKASETLTCITCHNPHEAPADLVAHHRSTCVSCHTEPSCGLPLSNRSAANGNDCAACHMPQSPTDVPHVAFTHHRIGIHPAEPAPPEDEGEFRRLAPMLDTSHLSEIDRLRSLGLAYLAYYRLHRDDPGAASYLAEARPLLEATAGQGLLDAAVMMAQAQFAGEAGDISGAQRWAQRALAADELGPEDRTAALRVLADVAVRQNRFSQAEGHLEKLTDLRRDPGDWFLLGLSRQRQGNIRGAADAFERVLEIDPARPETYEMLAPLYRALGDPEKQQAAQEKARRLREAPGEAGSGAEREAAAVSPSTLHGQGKHGQDRQD
jgi:hypothetical protein